MIEFSKFERILREYVNQNGKQDEYMESIPSDICSCFFDNGLTQSLYSFNDFLLKEAIGNDELYEWVSWFMFDRPMRDGKCSINSTDYIITDIESFLIMINYEYYNRDVKVEYCCY